MTVQPSILSKSTRADDLLDIGADEYFYSNGVCVVEWADLVADVIPDKAKVIIIKYGENQGERIYRCIF